MSSARRALFWIITTVVVVGAAGVGTVLGIEHGKGDHPTSSSQVPRTSTPKISSTQQVSAQPSPTSTLGQQVSVHPCIKDKKPQTLPTATGNPYSVDFSDSRLWLYGGFKSD